MEIQKDVRINADIPIELKKRLKLFSVKEDIHIKDIVILAIENYLDEMEGDTK